MEFIVDNYIWFIVGTVILLMTLIGYIAERTDFGHRKVEASIDKKKKKEEKLKKDKETLKNSALKLNDVVQENVKEQKVEPIDDWSSPFDKPTQSPETNENTNTEVNEDLNAPLPKMETPTVAMEEDLNAPLPEIETPTVTMEEDLNAPLPEIETPTITMEEDLNAPLPKMETPTVAMEEDLNAPLPEMETPNAELMEVSEVVPEVESKQVMEEINNSIEEVVVDTNEVASETPNETAPEENLIEEDNIWKF